MYIKRKSVSNSGWFLGIVLLLAVFKSLDYYKLVSFERSSSTIFIYLLRHPWLCILPVVLAAITFFLLHNRYLRSHLYLEELVREKKIKAGQRFIFLYRFGDIGDMIALDLKLIIRNKRPRTLIILSAVILFYGLIFYPQYLRTHNYSMVFLFAILITGLFISNYGQFLFAWQSSHFDGMMSYNFNVKQYIRAKFSLLITVCTLQFLIASLYGFMNWLILPIQLAAFLYCTGVNSFIVIYTATYNYRYINLGKSASMNFQGVGAMQWLQSLFISFGPVLVFFLLNKYAGFWSAIICLSSLGLVGLAFNETIINWLVKQFMIRKYKILEGFRDR